MQQSDFLELVFGDQQGYVVTQPRAAHHGVWRKWPSAFTTDDQYFSPIVYSNEQRTKDDTAATSLVIYVDADRTDLDEFFTWTPSIRVTTSEGSHHLYWVLDAPVPMKNAAALSQRIGRAHKMEPSAGIAAKLLRLPGTLNTSSEKIQGSEAFPVTAESTGLIYSYAELSAGYPADDHEGQDLVRPDLGMPDTWPNHFDVLDRVDGQSRLNLLLEAEFNTEDIDWSNKRYEALNLALEHGFTPAEATVLVWNSPLSDSKREMGIEHVWNYDTSKSVANQAAKDDPTLALPVEAPTDQVPVLRDGEVEASQVRTFVDDWSDAAFEIVHRKAPRQYLEMNAFSLLSAILTPHVGGWMPRGELQMFNLYVANFGDQATSKTQTMNYTMKFIRHYDDVVGTQIDTGSTFTYSGLIKALKDKHGQSSFIHTDEAGTIFGQWTQEAFSGAKDLFLQLYSTPWLPRHLLAGKDAGNNESVMTYFSAYFAGTPEETFSKMSRKMLRDGTTARLLPVMAKSLPQEFEDKLAYTVDRGDVEETETGEDPRYADFAERMQRLIRWTERQNKEVGPYRIAFTREARFRHGQLGVDLDKRAEIQSDPVAAGAHARRLAVTTWKLAGLLAAERYSDWIEVSDLLVAIGYADRAWGWMIEVMEGVADNEYTRMLNDLHQWLLANGPKVRTATAFKRSPLSTLQPKESIDVVNGLAVRGVIKPWKPDSGFMELIAKD